MDIGILGPLEVHDDRGVVQVPGGRLRDLIAYLACHVGEVVTSDRLIDGLWGTHLPANPANALQQRIVQARRLLDPDDTGAVVLTVPGGYRLVATPERVDATRFERLTAAGHELLRTDAHARAAATFAEALALWRGPALDGIDTPWAHSQARHLEELRLAAVQDRADALLALGEHTAVVMELEELVATHPLRERLVGQLMTALAHTGRQADALAVHRQVRTVLAEELGIDPSPALQRIHDDVLRQHLNGPAPVIAEPAREAGELPLSVSTFVGRREELRALGGLLADERMITLTGPGGAGKTRLAVEVARQARDDRLDRMVRLVELATLTDPAGVASTLAAGLGIIRHGPGGASTDVALQQALADRVILIVLDNCEHLLPAVGQLVTALLTRCPGVQVLATSREPLGVDGEIVWPVATLAVPARTARTLADIEDHDAVRLFSDRIAQVVPGHRLSDADAVDVGRIVRHLDGLPLAIELAAARARTLSIGEIAARLHDRFHLLAGGRTSLPTRHRALHDTLEWSWDLLDDQGRRAWMAASVPVGPFSADLLATLLDAVGVGGDTLEMLTALTDRSLLVVHDRGVPTRYRMLETLRQFAADHLARAGLDEPVRDAHARAVHDVIAAADRTTAIRWAVDLDRQRAWLPEVRAALRWHADQGERRAMQRLTATLGWLWYLTALAPEGLRWLDAALGPIGELDLEDIEPAAVLWAAVLRTNEAPDDHGLRWAQIAVDAADDEIDRSLATLFVLTHQAIAGDPARVLPALEQRAQASGWVEGMWRLVQAQLLTLVADAARAEPLLDSAEQMLVDHGAWFGIWTSATLAQLAQLRGDADAVGRVISRALPICTSKGVPELEVELRCVGAMVAAATADHPGADAQLQQADAVAERHGVAMSRALVAIASGDVLRRRGELDGARERLMAGLALHDRAGQPFGRPYALWSLGHVALQQDDLAEAGRRYGESLQVAHDRGDREGIACALEGLAAVAAAEGRGADGGRLLGAALAQREAIGVSAPILTRDHAAATAARLRDEVPAELFEAAVGDGRGLDDAAVLDLA